MKTFSIFALSVSACALALALSGCGQDTTSRPASPASVSPKPISQLNCPDRQGRLRRVAQARDGQGCDYSDNHGQDVSLRLIAIGNSPAETVLLGVENSLFALMPAADMPAIPPAQPKSPEPPHAKAPAPLVLPGIKVKTEHGKTLVQIGGLSIHTDDKDDSVRIEASSAAGTMPLLHSEQGSVSVNARADTAVIRMHDRGEGIRRSLIIACENPGPAGFRVVGYEARGPMGGPLVIATIKGKSKHERQVFKDLKALVALNSGR